MTPTKLDVMADKGFVVLKPCENPPEPHEWEGLEYVDWRSGGDTNFAILASANGDHDPRGFWEHGKADKDGVWTSNIEKSPTLKRWTESVGANFGRVRIIKLQPNTYEETVQNLHPDDNNRLTKDGEGFVVRAWLQLTDNPDSYMIVRDDKDDPSTESRIPLPRGAQFVVDSERLWHAVWHKGSEPRYALIVSYESGPQLRAWIEANQAS
ncbi:MAG: hypothetical protein M3P43_03255 [Actinomycetota bacterium]|nr:hypothetical protein [Actinomycetota bacterium]